MSDFLYFATQSRGEFGRLLLLMAEVERFSHGDDGSFWYHQDEQRQRMKEQLQRYLDALKD